MKGIPMTVYSVVIDVPNDSEPKIFRFRNFQNAINFSKGKTLYGQPASVQRDEHVPKRLTQRWSFDG
jgi:hypothetical protein